MDSRLLMILLGSFTGSIVQATTGFGCGIIQMIFFPLIFDLLQASALSSSICMVLTISLVFRFRKHVSLKKAAVPCILYTIASVVVIWTSTSLDMHILVLLFGVFLIVLALFFFLGQGRVTIRATPLSTFVIPVFSGVTGGLFGIGGPLMAPYFLDATSSKEEYIGTLQAVFTCTTMIGFVTRIFRGIYTISLVPVTLVGFVGVFAGRMIGLKILKKVSAPLLSKLVYIVIGLSGVLTVITNL